MAKKYYALTGRFVYEKYLTSALGYTVTEQALEQYFCSNRIDFYILVHYHVYI